MTTRKLFIIVMAAALFMGCNSKKDKDSKPPVTADSDTTTVPEKPAAPAGEIKLVYKSRGEDSLGTPHADVFLLADGKETLVKSINACNEIARTDYKTYEIPDAAISACGGWWAGAGDYYYLVMEEGQPAVYEGWQDESQKDKGYHWKKMNLK